MEEFLAIDPIRFVEDIPMLFILYHLYLKPFHKKILGALIVLAKNQRKLAKELDIEIEPVEVTGKHEIPDLT